MRERVPLHEERRLRFEAALRRQEGLSLEGASVLGDGFSSLAYVLADGETVARVPKLPEAEASMAGEVAVLRILEAAGLPAETPRSARLVEDGADTAGIVYRLVRGQALKTRFETIVSERRWEPLVRDLARFISAQHAIPAEQLAGLPSDLETPRYALVLDVSRPLLSREARGWLDGRVRRLAEMARPPSTPPVLAHCDLWGSNVLVDEHDRLAGVIDYGGVLVTDPAWDLMTFVELFGGEGLALAIECYERPLDADAAERAVIYRDIDELYDLEFATRYLGERDRAEALAAVEARAAAGSRERG